MSICLSTYFYSRLYLWSSNVFLSTWPGHSSLPGSSYVHHLRLFLLSNRISDTLLRVLPWPDLIFSALSFKTSYAYDSLVSYCTCCFQLTSMYKAVCSQTSFIVFLSPSNDCRHICVSQLLTARAKCLELKGERIYFHSSLLRLQSMVSWIQCRSNMVEGRGRGKLSKLKEGSGEGAKDKNAPF